MFKKLVFSLSVLTVLLSSCEKDLGNLGMGIMPSADILEVRIDSVSHLNFKYIPDNTDDTIRASQNFLLLGSYIDPIFGKVRSEIFAPLYFSNPVIDESKYQFEIVRAILKMTYNDTSFVYGKITNPLISIYRLNDSISVDDYRTLNFKPSHETLLLKKQIEIDLLSQTQADRIDTIDLPKSFITIIDNYIRKIDPKDAYSIDLGPDDVNKVFSKKFFGLHIRTDFDDAAIIKFRDLAIDIKVKIWDSENNVDTLTQEMILSDYVDRENYIYKQPLVKFELKPSSIITENIGKSNQKNVYIQPMKGYKAEFQFPDLDRWLDSSKVAINLAKLTIPIETKDTSDYKPIPKLLLYIYEKGGKYPISNCSFTSREINTNNQYEFFINDFMTYFLKKGKSSSEYRYEIVTPNNNLYANRSILLPENAKLHITYTKYK